MRFGIFGTGGIGGFYGALLARGGHEVVCIARGATLQALRERGLELISHIHGNFTVPVTATDDPSTVGPVDVLIISVKAYDLEGAAATARPLVGPDTVIIPIQNGIDHAERVARVLPAGQVMPGSAGLSSRVDAPGVIFHVGSPPQEITFGETNGGVTARGERVRDAIAASGLTCLLSEDIQIPLWQKFTFICAQQLTALMRVPIGPIMACDESSELYRGVLSEVDAVGRARGVKLPADNAEAIYTRMRRNQTPRLRTSMSVDLENGRRLELDTLNGTVVRLGRELGVPTPCNFAVYAALKPFINGPAVIPE